jgi:hypothetical protein
VQPERSGSSRGPKNFKAPELASAAIKPTPRFAAQASSSRFSAAGYSIITVFGIACANWGYCLFTSLGMLTICLPQIWYRKYKYIGWVLRDEKDSACCCPTTTDHLL